MKMKYQFPPVESADEDGVVAFGGKLDREVLLSSYLQGIFPWPMEGIDSMLWFAPNPRGIIAFDKFRIPKSFKRFLNNHSYQVSFNQNFKEVLLACAKTPRKGQRGTWINKEILEGYSKMFKSNYAYSVEVWKTASSKDFAEAKLVGGLYGVRIGDYFSAESMFHRETGASKLALYSLIKKLEGLNIRWLDTQMITPVVAQFGGIEIPREQFMKLLSNCQFDAPFNFASPD